MNKKLPVIICSLLLLLYVGNSSGSQEPAIYSASENLCNASCNFEYAKAQNCYAQEPAGHYTKQVLLDVMTKTSMLIKDEKAGVCVCVTAKLEKKGSFTDIIIKKSNNIQASEMVKAYLQNIEFSPVPDEASCLLEEPTNPIPISLDNKP